MERRDRQRGATLLMVIGVVAALAVLASALVFLIGNASANTARDRYRAKAFNMAEAAIDQALYTVGTNWPLTSDVTFSPSERTAFLDRFPSSEFPGKDVSITYFDNVDGSTAATPTRRDGNKDNLIYIEAQASVGGQKARIQTMAQPVYFRPNVPPGVAAGTDESITCNGSNPPIGLADAGSGQTAVTVEAGGSITSQNQNSTVCDANYPASNQLSGLGSNVVDGILDPVTVQQFIATAKAKGQFYSDILAEQAKTGVDKAKPTSSIGGGMPLGVAVIELDPAAPQWACNGNDSFNTVAAPGLLMVIGPGTMYPDQYATPLNYYSKGVSFGGNATYTGLLYTDGALEGNGTIDIVGMVLAKGSIDLAGSRTIKYSDAVVQNLAKAAELSAQIVPNTWRQIHPL